VLSVILETKNARMSGLATEQRVLDVIVPQLDRLDAPYEIIVVHGGERPALAGPDLRFRAAPGAAYYEQKNIGAQMARGELLLFVDSDIHPEPGYVEALVAPFADPAVQVVTGQCYIAPVHSFYDKVVALCYYFPTRRDATGLHPGDEMWANSLAIRRELFLARPFAVDTRLRGACRSLATELRAAGIVTWQSDGARCGHPKPRGWLGLARRALWDGHDRAVARRAKGKPMRRPARAARDLVRALRFARRAIDAGADHVGATCAERPLILTVAAAYELLVRVGGVATRIAGLP
jgi:hypothetical protein